MTVLDCTDDTVILGEKPATVQAVLDHMVCEDMAVGLEINSPKTKVFRTSQQPSHCSHIEGDNWEQAFHFKHLASII